MNETVTTAHRRIRAPELQPLSDQGFNGLDVTAWYGVYAPLKTAAPVLKLLRDSLQKVFQDPGVRQKLNGAGIELIWQVAEDQTANRIKTDLARYRGVVQAARIKAN